MSTSTAPQMSNVPEWDLGDRLGKSLRTSGVKVQEMADYMQMSRGSVGNWINGRIKPDHRTLVT